MRTLLNVSLLCGMATLALAQSPLTSQWTYQGKLSLAGSPFSDSADFEFTLWDAAAGGNQIGSTLAVNDLQVVDGFFTVDLDFGMDALNGDARWLEIAVRSPAGSGAITTLDPRQPLSAAPYALQTRGLVVDGNDNVITVPDQNSVSGVTASTVSGGRAHVVTGNQATIGGGQLNTVGRLATVGGGLGNTAQEYASTVAGGSGNTVSGNSGAITGGSGNVVSDAWGFVGGGESNAASGRKSTVAGGQFNIASGQLATVPGGFRNEAAGNYALAAGYGAEALHHGTFVWSDSRGGPFQSTDADQFLINAQNGVGIGTNSPSAMLDVAGDIRISGLADLYFDGPRSVNSSGLGWYGNNNGRHFGPPGGNPGGPVLYGDNGGALGTTKFGNSVALSWTSTGVTAWGKARIYGSLGVGTNLTAGCDVVVRNRVGNDDLFILQDADDNELLQVTSTGRFGLRDSSGNMNLQVDTSGNVAMPRIRQTTVGDYDVVMGSDGFLRRGLSSRRYKENIEPFVEDFDRILDAQPMQWTGTNDPSGRIGVGYIAEEIDALGLEQLVVYDSEGQVDSLKYSRIPIYTLEVVKRHERELTALRDANKSLRAERDELRGRLGKLESLVKRLSER